MKTVVVLVFMLLIFGRSVSQSETIASPTVNLRASFLLFPFTPLATLEVRTVGNLTIQFESNFVNTQGANLKYYTNNRMYGDYVFIGLALVENDILRDDENTTFLPYAGYGYAYRFGNKNQWIFDSRIGIGATTNADSNGIYPVLKTGIGLIF